MEARNGPDSGEKRPFLNALGLVLLSEDRRAEAMVLFERARAISERDLGPDHPTTAMMSACVASVHWKEGGYEQARRIFARVLATFEAAFGAEDPRTSLMRFNLASTLRGEGRLDEAQELFEQCRGAYVRRLGERHPMVANVLTALAGIFRSRGQLAAAREALQSALEIDDVALGPSHLESLDARFALATTCLDEGDAEGALACADRLLADARAGTSLAARESGAADVGSCLVQLSRALSLRFTLAAAAGAANDVWADVLVMKGFVAREISSRRAALAAALDPAIVSKLDRLRSVRVELSRAFSTGDVSDVSDVGDVGDVGDRAAFDTRIEGIRRERDVLEAAVQAAIAGRAETRAALPADAVLIDFLELSAWESTYGKAGAGGGRGRWSTPRMHAWISRAGSTVTEHVDLGPVAELSGAVRTLFETLVAGRGAAAASVRGADAGGRETPAAALRRVLWDPLAPHVGEGRRLIVSASGPLRLLPFGIVSDADGRHLLERFTILYVDEAGELATRQGKDAAVNAVGAREPDASALTGPSLLVAGAVDFDAADEEAPLGTAPPEPEADLRGSFARAWIPLSSTGVEAAGIARLHRRRFATAPRVELRDDEPSEERLKRELPRATLVHLATHGYFLADGLRSLAATLDEPDDRARLDSSERRLLEAYFPSLLCGLVYAGANASASSQEDGLLTGEEVSALELSRCDLVVLSACESGLGKEAFNSAVGQGAMSLARCRAVGSLGGRPGSRADHEGEADARAGDAG